MKANVILLKFKTSALKGNFKRIKRIATEWDKIFENTYLIKDLFPKYTNSS